MSENPNRRITYLAALAIVAVVLVSSVALTRPPQTAAAGASSKTIQVTGTGTVSGTPDQALLTLAVQTQASTATQTTAENAAVMTNVMKALAAAGISNDSIATVSYSLSAVYSNPVNQSIAPTIIAYTAVNTIQVTLSNLGEVGRVLDETISAGVNQVQGITFTLSNTSLVALEKQALQLAIQDANNQAQATAGALGVSLIGPTSVTPGYVFQPTTYNRFSLAPAVQTPIQPGTLQVTATAQVTYAFS